jgi:two-component system, NtrC family, sensor kinase
MVQARFPRRGTDKKPPDMVLSRKSHGAIVALGAAILLGALVFLFVRTEGIDFKSDAQALGLLREMKDLDTRWDADALGIANSFAPSSVPILDRGPLVTRLLKELEASASRDAFAGQLRGMRSDLAEKDAAFKTLRATHARTLESLKGLDESLHQLAQVAAARSAASRGANRGPGVVAALVEQLRSDVQRPDVETFEARAPSIERRIATLRLESVEIDPMLGSAAATAENAARGFLAARTDEAAAWRKFSFLTLGSRIELAARSYAKAIENALDEKDRWRVYLLFYAGALLIVIGYLGTRIAQAQGELRRANEDLEKRVSERTRDLSSTLKQLKESEAQLVQSEKMSSLGQMVAGVAHEINSPLAYVKNSVAAARDRMPDLREALELAQRLLEIVRSGSADPAQLQSACEALESRLTRLRNEHALEDLDTLTRDGLHGIEQIVDLVKNLRNFSRLDRSKVASFNVNEGVQATLLIAKPNLRKVDVVKRLGDVPSITCSPSQVNQVLLNLVTNAAQAMDKPRGNITVSTRPGGLGAVVIEVEDNGKGIATDALPKIFDPFYTTKEVGKGTGLGLSIAYKIVTQHGGKITVSSTVGVGTKVTVTLPVDPPADLAAVTEAEERAA